MSDAATGNLNEIDADTVSRYLLDNPDFFLRHPEVLRQIQVPHGSGEAVSLVEKQVALLREQNEQTQKRLYELIEIARQNEELARRMHALALTLMDASRPAEIFSTLYENLRRDFKVDHVAVRLFADPLSQDIPPDSEFAGSDTGTAEYAQFKTILEKRMAISGRLKSQQQVFLFGSEGDDIASAVIVPLHGKGWSGVLSIASTDSTRFTESMGVELLGNLGEILSFILKPWIREG
jgi:hypothetical protein